MIHSRTYEVYRDSDAHATKLLHADLLKRGPAGEVAKHLICAQKASSRAKKYGRTAYRGLSYDRKGNALKQLCEVILKYSEMPNPPVRVWGWKKDPKAGTGPEWVLYVELYNGQISFHSVERYEGPDYLSDWDGLRKSEERIIAFCDLILDYPPVSLIPPAPAPSAEPCKVLEFRSQGNLFG